MQEIVEKFLAKKINYQFFEESFQSDMEEMILSNYFKMHMDLDMSFANRLSLSFNNQSMETIYETFYAILRFPFKL